MEIDYRKLNKILELQIFPLYSITDMARRWQQERQTVNNWKKRHKDFPKAIEGLIKGTKSVYPFYEVLRYESQKRINMKTMYYLQSGNRKWTKKGWMEDIRNTGVNFLLFNTQKEAENLKAQIDSQEDQIEAVTIDVYENVWYHCTNDISSRNDVPEKAIIWTSGNVDGEFIFITREKYHQSGVIATGFFSDKLNNLYCIEKK